MNTVFNFQKLATLNDEEQALNYFIEEKKRQWDFYQKHALRGLAGLADADEDSPFLIALVNFGGALYCAHNLDILLRELASAKARKQQIAAEKIWCVARPFAIAPINTLRH